MEISKGCNVAGDGPTESPGGTMEPIWFQILMLSPEEEGGKKENIGLAVWLLAVENR